MTTEHSMLAVLIRQLFRRTPGVLALGLAAGLTTILTVGSLGCQSTPDPLTPPRHTVAPYDTRAGDVLWAVAPPRNESGTTAVATDRVADAIVAAAQQARGISAVPFDRTLAAMRALGLDSIATTADARALAGALGVDGVIVTSVTAWDPYDPPTVGLSMALFMEPEGGNSSLDLRELVRRGSEPAGPGAGQPNQGPVSVVSEHLDAQNHEVLMAVRRYAEGRSESDSALGWRVYTASMELFTEFAAHHGVERLVRDETLRLARASRSSRGE